MSGRPVFGVTPPPRKRTTRQDRWEAAYKVADTLYTAKECGCLVLIMVDMPDVIRDSKNEILRESLAGRALRRIPRGALPPLNCSEHQREPKP